MSIKHYRRLADRSGLAIRSRVDSMPRALTGHASVFDQWTTLYTSPSAEIREVIRPGAFAHAITSGQDVRALVNHDPSLILGRTRAGTLSLSEDARGLLCDISPPDTQAARDVMANVEAGNVTQMSFAFLPRDGGETITTRTEAGRTIQEVEITDCDLYDVSIVTYPAYESSDVQARSIALKDQLRVDRDQWLNQRRMDLDRLGKSAVRSAS